MWKIRYDIQTVSICFNHILFVSYISRNNI